MGQLRRRVMYIMQLNNSVLTRTAYTPSVSLFASPTHRPRAHCPPNIPLGVNLDFATPSTRATSARPFLTLPCPGVRTMCLNLHIFIFTPTGQGFVRSAHVDGGYPDLRVCRRW